VFWPMDKHKFLNGNFRCARFHGPGDYSKDGAYGALT